MSSHFEQLLALLQLERDEDFKQYQQYVLQAPLSERKAKGFCWHPVRIHAQELGTGAKLYLTLERPGRAEGPSAFQTGAAVALFGQAEGKTVGSLPGVITALWPDRMKVALAAEDLPDWADEARLGVDLLFDNTTYQEMERAVRQVAQAEQGRLAQLRAVLLGEQPARFVPLAAPVWLPQLNEWQNQALNQVLAAQEVAIVHGPPGTGKTTTLVAIVGQVLKTERQVLVTAPSNAAVDLLAERLAQTGLRVLRLGNPARVGEAVQPHTFDGQLEAHPRYKDLKKLRKDAETYRSLAHKYKRNFGPAEREQRRLLFAEAKSCRQEAEALEQFLADELLGKAQVIAATLVGTAHSLLGQRRFSTVFIDEAAQALEPGAWIPLLRAERVVMAGDHCQLPPTVKSVEAARRGLARTLFEQCVARHRALIPVDTLLREQYRMNETIMGFSNQQFYEGQLVAAPAVAHWQLAPDQPPLVLIDTAGTGFAEEPAPQGGSLANPGEAQLVVKHLAQTLAASPGPLTVGVISPYKRQANLLAEQLQAEFAGIEADTVDSFQGQERDLIYISLVRSNPEGEIGFLKDTRRMNVAMTRAKKQLVIIGDSATIGRHPFYQTLLAYVEAQGTYQSAWEWA
ncbi:MAG: AAA domain-containing protein [Bernardetiaceae bacterium]|jgi:superfamily I DNA and/or RNA helicase|nr:AAA domain-containing protein [Bernardetiaceae bacterium]